MKNIAKTTAVWAVLMAMIMYFYMPAINLRTVFGMVLAWLIVNIIVNVASSDESSATMSFTLLLVVGIIGVLVGVVLNAMILSDYAKSVGTNVEFTSDITPFETTHIYKIPYETAFIKAKQRLGNYGTLYTIRESSEMSDYQVINGTLYWIVTPEFTGFWSRLRKSAEGIPVVYLINAESDEIAIERVQTKVIYSPFNWFHRNSKRRVYFRCMTCYISEPVAQYHDGTVYFIYGLSKPKYFWAFGKEFYGVAVVNSRTGEVEIYHPGEIPDWITVKYPESLVEEWFDVWGKYRNGVWNKITSKEGVLIYTGDAQLIYTDDGKLYWYTMYRPVKGQESATGVAYMDMETGKIYFVEVNGTVISDDMAKKNIESALGADLRTMVPTEPILYAYRGHYFYAAPVISNKTSDIMKYAIVDAKSSRVFFGNTYKDALDAYLSKMYGETVPNEVTSSQGTGNATVAKIVIIKGNETIVIPIEENSTIVIKVED